MNRIYFWIFNVPEVDLKLDKKLLKDISDGK